MSESLPAPVVRTLASAGIPVTKVGRKRGDCLEPAERDFYVWILRQFANGEPPSADAIASEAERLQLDVAATRAKFVVEDLIHFDSQGRITVAYPFSGRPTPHRVRIDGRSAYSMCAIDALGIAPMLGETIEVTSRDPLTDVEIHVLLHADGSGTWEPNEAVVVSGRACEGAAFQGCCQVLNFFASRESAERYLRERDDVRGEVVSLPQAIEAGRSIFGDILRTS
jgi:hypothetical protein